MKKKSDGVYRNHKALLKDFFEYFNEPIIKDDKQNVFMWDVKDYFINQINPKGIKQKTKKVYRAYLKRFFNHVIGSLVDKKIPFHNPVPDESIYEFDKLDSDISKKSERDKKKLSKNQIQEILDFIKKNIGPSTKKKIFVLYALHVCTGARTSEIRTIKIKDVNLKERYFETGFEKNARKSTYNNDESLMFFFPEGFVNYLKNYIIPLKKKGETWLFPRASDNSKPITEGTATYYYKKIRKNLGFKFSMHYFRHSFISHLKSNGCSRDEREELLNHSPSSTQAKFYEHDDLVEMRKIYDKYFPYYDFAYFKKK